MKDNLKMETVDCSPTLSGYKSMLKLLEQLEKPNKCQRQSIKELRAWIKQEDKKAEKA